MKRSIIGFWGIILGGLFLVPLSAPAQVVDITVAIDGLACPFCAYSLEKNLKRIDGVNGLVVNVKDGTATLTPAPDGNIDLKSIPRAVTKAGFTPRTITVNARGQVQSDPEGSTLAAPDGTRLFNLVPNDVLAGLSRDDGRSYLVSGVVVLPEAEEKEADLLFLAITAATPGGNGEKE